MPGFSVRRNCFTLFFLSIEESMIFWKCLFINLKKMWVISLWWNTWRHILCHAEPIKCTAQGNFLPSQNVCNLYFLVSACNILCFQDFTLKFAYLNPYLAIPHSTQSIKKTCVMYVSLSFDTVEALSQWLFYNTHFQFQFQFIWYTYGNR